MSVSPQPPSERDVAQQAAGKLRTALALFDSGLAMKRAQLRREDRGASEEQIARRVAQWLRDRPGAPCGDAEGLGKVAADPT